jgi:molybdopterin-guanine dinucleotide biosynthesis protein A
VAHRPLTGVLLVGGASTRFGSPKAHAVFRGETLAERAWRLLGDACEERLAVGRADGLPFATLPDARDDAGPLGGIVAGLRAAAHDLCVVVPVDMPLLDAGSLHALAGACRDVAVGPRGPLPAAFARRALPVLEEALARGRLRLRDAIAPLDVSTVELDPAMLRNVNTPGDLPSGGVFRVGGDAYDDFMGRYSVRLAPRFADFAGVGEGMRALDVGAGTGALTGELLRRGAEVVAAEPSPEFCATLRDRFPQLEVHQAPAETLPFEDGSFDAALAQLVVAFMADAPTAARELARVARTVALCMWGVQEMEMFAAIDRTARAIGVDRGAEDGARRYRNRAELVELLEPLGEVTTGELDVQAGYDGFDDFWSALSRQVGPAGAWLARLDDDERARAREALHRELGSPDGPFELRGRAYAVKITRG